MKARMRRSGESGSQESIGHDRDSDEGRHPRSRNRDKFTFNPIEFNVGEILQSAQQDSKVAAVYRSAIVDKHKAYKSAKDDVNRADLYKALLQYLRTRNFDQLQNEKYFKKLDHTVFDINVRNRGLTRDDLRKKVAQKLTRNILGLVSQRKISSIAGYLVFLDIVDNSAKKTWSSYLLRGAQESSAALNHAVEEAVPFIKKVKSDVLNRFIERGEDHADYFVEYAIDDDLVFFGVCRAKLLRMKRTFVTFAYKLGSTVLYASGIVLPEVLEVVVDALGFTKYSNHSLNGVGLSNMIEAHTRELRKFSMKELKQKIDEDEQKRNEEGLNAYNPRREKLMKLQTALLHDDRDAPNPIKKFDIDFSTPYLTEDGEVDQSKAPACSRTRITVHGGNADEYFADLHREGFITDIALFVKLKEKRANAIVLRKGPQPV